MEFVIEKSDDGRTKAIEVTGPDGATVQGAPQKPISVVSGGSSSRSLATEPVHGHTGRQHRGARGGGARCSRQH